MLPPKGGRAAVLAALPLLAAALPSLGCGGPPGGRLSVLLITIDTLRADHLGCYGYARGTSPHIDRLAAQGVRFSRVTTSLPRTTQSIASILTGRYPKNHGARGLFSTLPATNSTLAEILRGEGYRTGAVVSNMFLAPGRGFDQGFEAYDDPEGRYDGDSAPAVTAAAVEWLRRLPARAPYFLWVHYLDPHWTYEPAPPYDSEFDPGYEGRFGLYDDLRAGRLSKGEVIFRNRLPPRQVRHVVALYDGEIAGVDAALGPLLDAVEARHEPLLVVLTSDHGESLGEHGYHFAHGEYLYEDSLHVPLLLRLDGRIPAGSTSEALAQNIDVAPTILAILGVPGLQGSDGRPLLVGEQIGGLCGAPLRSAPGRSVVFSESDYQLIHPENPRFYRRGPAGRWTAASDGRHKVILIPVPGGEIIEYYDLAADPGETRNLEDSGLDRETRARLLRELRSFADYEGSPGPGVPEEIGPAERERLRSLGYIN
jgi:arylsulfatase A-like enzyme